MSHEVKERHWSWVIAFACCFINCLLYGVSRLSGLLLVATVDAFGVTRARAALPYSISTSVRNLSGIFVGYLGQKFGLRAVISAGCILASLGAACCFFVSDIVWISVCWGGFFGMGCGLATCLLPLAINQNFGRHRGTASGISYSGSYIGSFAFPPLVVQLLDRYGLSGTFLVISGTMLNGLAAAMLFRSPRPQQSNTTGTKSLQCHPSSGLNSRLKSFMKKLSDRVNLRKTDKNTTELPLTHVTPDIYLIAYEPLRDWNLNKRHAFPLGAKVVISDTMLRKMVSLGYFDQTDGISNSQLRFSYSVNENYNLKILQAKNESYPSEYKPKISKLWEIIKLHLFKNRGAFESSTPSLSNDNVELTSFRNLECVGPIESNVPIQSLSHRKHQHSNNVFDAPHGTEVVVDSMIELDVSSFTVKNSDVREQSKSIHLDANSNIPFLEYNNELCRQETDVNNDLNTCHNETKVSRVSSVHNSSNKTTGAGPNSSVSNDKHPPSKDNSSRIQSSVIKDMCRCCFGWFRMFSDPMFVVITVTMSLHTFVIVCMVTIIEDFARDLQVPCNRVHHVIMALSTADLVGALSLGTITDRGFISREVFMVLCLLGTGATAIAISFSQNLTMLLVLVAFYGLFETGVIITFPLLIAQFIREKKQPVALASSNVLSSPTVLFVPPLIGYFRDNIGCYSGVFYVLGATSFVSSFIWLLAPFVLKRYRTKQQPESQLSTC